MRPLPSAMSGCSTDWDLKTSAWLADASALAYEDSKQIERAFEGVAGLESIAFIDINGTQAYLATFESCNVLAVRGTEADYADILRNITFRKCGFGGGCGSVHAGYFLAALSLETLVEYVWNRRKPRPVYFTGHSAGGAIASLLADQMHSVDTLRPGEAVAYTYGAPRTGDWQYRECERATHYRHTNAADIVPSIPPLLLGYSHHGEHAHFLDDGTLVFNARISTYLRDIAKALFKSCLKRTGWKAWLPLRLFTDHRVSAYQVKFWRQLDA